MRKLLGVIAAILVAAGVPAGAADMPVAAAPPPVALFDWNGFYLGASFDWTLGRMHDRYFNGGPPLAY
jgi:hypothetical protein